VQWDYTGTLPWFVQNASTATSDQVMGSYLTQAISPPPVMGTWTGLQLFAAAARNVSATPTAQDIYDGMSALNGKTLGRLTAPLTLQEPAPPGQLLPRLRSQERHLLHPPGNQPHLRHRSGTRKVT